MVNKVLYIGVTGLLAEHVEEISTFYEELTEKMDSERKKPILFLGLQTSRKFLNGEKVNPIYASRMNTAEQIVEACKISRPFLNSGIVVHYNPSGGYNLPGAKEHLCFFSRIPLYGIQWNGFSTKQSYEETLIQANLDTEAIGLISILQIGKNDYENPIEFAQRIKNPTFVNSSHLLLDGSCGRGLPIDVQKAIDWIRVLQRHGNTKGVAISGGLGPDNLHAVQKIKKVTGLSLGISIDAEGNLREGENFSVKKAKRFLEEAVKLYV